jgi:predicted PurR-regulated permease PerM
MLNFIIPPMISNIKYLIYNVPIYQSKLQELFNEANGYFNQLNIGNIGLKTPDDIIKKATDIVAVIGDKALLAITYSITSLSSFVVEFVLSFILTFYFLKEKEVLFFNFNKLARAFIPEKSRRLINEFLNNLDEVVGSFLMGAILDAIIVGIVSVILLLFIHHPFAILVGCIAGVLNLIPYIGPLIGGLLALGLGFFDSVTTGVLGLALLVIYQQIDGNIVQPKIIGEKVGVPPVWVLIAILIGGSYFGIPGMIFAVPAAGLILIYLKKYLNKKQIE